MKKINLENRMVVELNNGSRGLIVDDRIITNTGYLLLDNYNDDLTNKYSTIEDIVKIYNKAIALNDICKDGSLEILWERPWKPEKRDKYYIIEFANEELFAEQYWTNAYYDNELYNKGLVFKTKEEAIECAKKMLKIAKKGV